MPDTIATASTAASAVAAGDVRQHPQTALRQRVSGNEPITAWIGNEPPAATSGNEPAS